MIVFCCFSCRVLPVAQKILLRCLFIERISNKWSCFSPVNIDWMVKSAYVEEHSNAFILQKCIALTENAFHDRYILFSQRHCTIFRLKSQKNERLLSKSNMNISRNYSSRNNQKAEKKTVKFHQVYFKTYNRKYLLSR